MNGFPSERTERGLRLLSGAKLLALVVVTAGAAIAWTGCDDHDHDDHDHADGGTVHDSPYPSCKAIIEVCHEVDVGAGPVHDCHETAHDAKGDSDCAPTKDSCVALCKAAAADAGGTEDGGTEEHDHDE